MENYSNKLNEIFRGSNRAHGTFTVDIATTGQKKSGKAKTIKTVGATTNHWDDHLSGKSGLGIIPIDEENMVRWGEGGHDPRRRGYAYLPGVKVAQMLDQAGIRVFIRPLTPTPR